MKKKFTTLQLFNFADGRLSTGMDDIYDILNHVCDQGDSLMTHHLPVAYKYLKEKNPKWLQEQKERLNTIRSRIGSNNFETLIGAIKDQYNEEVEVPQLKDEVDTSDFESYMIDNSLLLKRTS